MTLPRVLSYPPVHDYVDRLHGRAAELVHRDQAWPRLPDLYDPTWIRDHAGDWDVAHFHFTWEQYRPRTFEAVLGAHRGTGTPMVWTAHDLRNPHTSDVSHDEEYLSALGSSMDVVVTLTKGAANQLDERFGVEAAAVVPHGPVIPVDAAERLRRRPTHSPAPLRVLLLAKSLRANLDWETPMRTVARLARGGTRIQLTVHLHDEADRASDVLALAHPPAVQVDVGMWLPPHELWEKIAAADVLLLPYRWGTHSGLLELATDLGTQVVAADVGFLREQAPCHLVPVSGHTLDPEELERILSDLASGEGWLDPVPLSVRAWQLEELLLSHTRIYGRLTRPGTAEPR